MNFKNIKYINLHAHSDYSLQDGVGDPAEHFLETIQKGHTGCCITDHCVYAAPFELYNLKLKEKKFADPSSKMDKKDKEIHAAFQKHGKKNHSIVPGVELYVFDDQLKVEIEQLLKKSDLSETSPEVSPEEFIIKIKSLISSAKNDDRYKSLFSTDVERENRETVSEAKKKAQNSIGDKVLTRLSSVGAETSSFAIGSDKWYSEYDKLRGALVDFAQASIKCGSYKYNHITVMAKNETGHRNICKLVSNSHLPENYYYRPRISLSELIKRKDGIIATTGCFIGMIPQAIFRKTGQEKDLMELFLREFGDDFYVEVHLGDLSWDWNSKLGEHVKIDHNPQLDVNLRLLELVNELGMRGNTYITQDSHMPKKEDKEHQDLMILSDNDMKAGTKKGWHFHDAYYIMSVEEMWEKTQEHHPYITEDDFVLFCENTQKVQEKCKDFYIDKRPKLVNFNPDDHHSTNPKRIKKDLVIPGEKKRKYGRSIESLVKESKKSLIQDHELDPIETEKARIGIQNANREMNELAQKYKNEYFLQKVMLAEKTDPKLSALIRTCFIKKKIDFENKKYRDRFFYEVNTVQLNGYEKLSDYFMMVEELPYVTRELGEIPGLGRGSAAGSLMCYALDITNVDSVKMDLSFARFLPKERNGFLIFNFEAHPFIDYINKLYPGGDETFSIELLVVRDRFFNFINDKAIELQVDLNSMEYKRELEYLFHNPEICKYLLDLLEIQNGSPLENDCNSAVANLIGLANKNSKSIDEEKGSMPDIDYDSSCRDDICEFESQKLGKRNACLIGTYGSLQIKSALKEILRIKPAFNEFGKKEILTPAEQNKVAQLFDRIKFSEEEKAKGSLWMLEECVVRSEDIKRFFDNNSDIFEYTKKVLGTKKSWGIHAAGLIMSEFDITSWIPCFYSEEKGAYVSQLPMGLVEDFGFVKMDALGLITCEIIRDAFYMILENHGINLFDKMEEIAFNEDPKVLSNFSPKADTLGIFQFGPPVPTAYLRRVKNPIKFSFLPMTTSELRPGPMAAGVPEEVLKVINGVSPATYLHPILEGVLEKTFGYVVYQEQVIKICILMGLTPFEADTVRRAMGKKKFDLIQKYKAKFIEGALKKGVNKQSAEEIWHVMEKFAEYGFNESHAVAYAGLSVIQMYIKTYYLSEFIAASLSTFSKKDTPGNKENYKKFQRVYKDVIVTPDVQTSQMDYVIKNGKVTMPIFSISRIGEEVSKNVFGLAPYSSFNDMIFKFKANKCESKTVVENLILSGACDSFRPSFLNVKKTLLEKVDMDEDEKLKLVKPLFEILAYKLSNGLDEDVKKITDDFFMLGLNPNSNELDRVFDSKVFKKGMSVFEFRKYLLGKYYGDLYHRKLHKKIDDSLKSEFPESPENDVKSASARYIIFTMDDAGKDVSSVTSEVSRLAPVSSKVIPEPKKIVSRGTESNVNKVSEIVDLYENWTVQEMIIKELELLKTTTYDFSSLIDNNHFVSDCMPISKLKTNLESVRSKLEVCVGGLDSIRALIIKRDITPKEAINATTEIFNVMASALPKHTASKVFGKFIKILVSDERISIDDKNEMITRIGIALNDKNTRTIPKDIRRSIVLKSVIGRKYLSAFKSITKVSDSDFVRNSEINMGLDLSIVEEFRFHLFSYIIMNGKVGIDLLNSKFPDCGEITNIGKSVVDLGINASNIAEWRAVLSIFDFKNPFNIILSGDGSKNTDLGEASISDLLLRVRTFDFSSEEIKVMNNKISISGAVFRPEKKKDFKREYLSNMKLKTRLTITVAENGDDVVDVTIFDSGSYQPVQFGNDMVPFEDILKDYSMVKMRIKAQFTDDLSDFKFTLDMGENTVLPIRFNQIKKAV